MWERVPARLALAVLSFFGYINLYLIRFNFSVISVAMITPFEQQHRANQSCDAENVCTTSDVPIHNKNTLDWDERTRALVLGVFNYGYCLTQVIGGRLADKYGTKYVFWSAITIPALLTFFIPMGAKSSYWWVVGIRFLQGVIQGVSWPSMMPLLVKWYPSNERSRFAGIVLLGASLGMVFILPFSGLLCDLLSWEEACYITAVFPLVWGIFWILLMHPTPQSHPRISEGERSYIESAVAEAGTRALSTRSVPWKSIVTSLPFIAIIICDIGNSYGLTIYASQMPNYVASMFNFSMSKSGFIAGLPFLFRYCGSSLFSSLADYIITKKYFTIGTTRRIFSIVAMIGPSTVMVVIILFFLTDPKIFGILICTALFLNGSIAASQLINTTDIAPNLTGTLFGISNTFSGISSFICLFITGEILNKEPTLEQWTIVFWLCVPILVATEIFFLIFMSGEIQPWNYHGQDEAQVKATYKEDSVSFSREEGLTRKET